MKASDCLVPRGVKVITFGVDFQIDRCELEFVGWGEGEENWGLGFHKLYGDFSEMKKPGRPWAYDVLEGVLIREFRREDGAILKPAAGCFDTGYAKAQRALYQFVRPRFTRKYYATKGANQKWAPAVAQGRREEKIRLFIIGTNRVKSIWYDRATVGVPGPGYIHIPSTDDYSDEWFKQFLSEDSHTVKESGVEMRLFQMPATPREGGSHHNEALDIRVLALVALYIRGSVNWDLEEKRNLKTIASAKEAKVAAVDGRRPRKTRNKRAGSWLKW